MPATASQSTGVLAAAIAKVRQLTDEPDIRAKYSDAAILDLMNESWQEVLPDLWSQADNPPYARYSVTLVQGQRYYNLPCTVGEIQRIANRDVNNRVKWEIIPRERLNPWGPGITFEGNQRFLVDPDLLPGETVEVLYIPSGDCYMAAGTCTPVEVSDSTLNLLGTGTTTTLGTVDRRPNAYLGGILSIPGFDGSTPSGYGQFPVQQRIIKEYDVSTGILTVEPDFDVDLSALTPGDSTFTWEVYPIEATCVWPVITRHAARQILYFENKEKRMKNMTQMYQEAKRACTLRWNSFQNRSADTLGTNTVSNSEYWWGVQ